MLTAFLGCVLPWGQISFCGGPVITNFCSAIPYVGSDIVQWIWGGFSLSNATLNRFFSLHYLFPFFIVGLALLHIISLHTDGSIHTSKLRALTFRPLGKIAIWFIVTDFILLT